MPRSWRKLRARDKSLAGYLRAHLDRIKRRRLLRVARLHPNERRRTRQACRQFAHAVRDKKHVATCLGFGPRFLHSTGQAYKGGPNSGVFLQITCDDAVDLPVPEQKYTFGIVKAAQARGDFQVLAERGRRALRVHLGKDLESGLQHIASGIQRSTELEFLAMSTAGRTAELIEPRRTAELAIDESARSERMQLGMVGLGRMGANMARRLMRGGHEVVVTDLSADAVKDMAGEGAIASSSLDDFVRSSESPRAPG